MHRLTASPAQLRCPRQPSATQALAPLRRRQLCARPCRAAPPEQGAAEPATPPSPAAGAAAPAPKSTGELAKEALLQTINSDKTTAADVLGESTLVQLRRALGEERARQFESALDGLLANRRLATLVLAVVDVALIVVAIKVFRATVLHE